MHFLTDFSGLSVLCSGMPVKTRLSLTLRDCKSRIVAFIASLSAVTEVSCVVTEESWVVSVLTDCCRDLFSFVSVLI